MYIEKKMLKKYISYWLATMFCIVSIMIVVGGLTRLTDSGLSITEWELFSGFYRLLMKRNGMYILTSIRKFLSISCRII